jgi:REP element-mobilizing transposase RayT
MVTISRDSPCLSITAVAKDRLPIFRTHALKALCGRALDEARASAGFLIFAYVIMPDHLHIITNGPANPRRRCASSRASAPAASFDT